MITRSTLSGTLLCIALLAVGCGSPSGPTDKPSTEPGSPAPEPAQTQTTAPAPAEEAQVADATVAADEPVDTPVSTPQALAPSPDPAPATAPAATTAKEPTAATPTTAKAPPVATPTPAPTPSAAAPAPAAATAPPPAALAAASAIADPGGTVAVAATKPGLERIGAEACGDCHDVQFESWAGGAHAKRKPPLDCEHCHGPGSEYEPKSVMKDPAKAKAAGLVMPDKAFCAKCHKQGVDDAFMEKAHAHAE